MIYKQPTSLILIRLMAMSRVAATNKLVSIAIDKIDSGSNAKKNLNALLRE